MSESVIGTHLALGEEEFLRARVIADLTAQARADAPDLEISELRAAGADPGELADLLGLSLFAQPRLVVIDGVQEGNKDFAEAVASAVDAREPDLTLILTHAGGARQKALIDRCRKAGATVHDCAKLTRQDDRLRFVRREAERAGGAINAPAAAALLDAVGNDLRELSAATGQLVADSGGRVDPEAVARYHRGRPEVSGFTVAERVLVGDLAASMEALRWALGHGVPPVVIADALADGVRTVARVISVGRGDAYDLARTLGMPPWKVKKAQQQSRGWRSAGLLHALGVVSTLNADVKGAAASAEYSLERALRDLVAARGDRAA